MAIVFASICPHPPIIIPTIGQASDLKLVSKTIKAMEELAKAFRKSEPETVILISPHGPVDFDHFTLNLSPTFIGHFYQFGDFQTKLTFQNNQDLIEKIKKESQNIPLREVFLKELDHGALVPLYYLAKEWSDFKLLPLAFSYLDRESHFTFGKILQKVTKKERIAFIASGDLSHCLTFDAPGGYSEKGKEFDEKLVKLLKEKETKGILNLEEDLVEEAGECGFRSILILLGVLDGLNYKPEILSYEGPFGVGYLVANFKISNF